MLVLLTPVDIADRIGRDLTPEELRRITALIVDVTALAARLAPCLTVPNPRPDLLAAARAILAGALVRAVDNPGGYTSERIGDYSYTRDNPGKDASGLLNDAEQSMIAALCGLPAVAGSNGAYSVPLHPPETTMGWRR